MDAQTFRRLFIYFPVAILVFGSFVWLTFLYFQSLGSRDRAAVLNPTSTHSASVSAERAGTQRSDLTTVEDFRGGLPEENAGSSRISAHTRDNGDSTAASQEAPKFFRRAAPSAPKGGALDIIDSQITRAEGGDADSAFAVFSALNRCLFGDPATSACDAIPPELSARRLEFLKIAAERGNIDAQIQFAASMGEAFSDPMYLSRNMADFETYKADSVRHLQAAASRGSADALLQLGFAFEEGILVNEDPVLAYAYFLAADRTGLFHNSAWNLVRLSRNLTAAQAARATGIADQMVANCCS